MENDLPLFSIIMPVYNVAKYLEEAINSLLMQTYSNWELILVNDASSDASLTICNQYAALDKRILVIDKKENEGPGIARNTGMVYANGDWVLFMDSDDSIVPFALEQLKFHTKKSSLDVIVFGYFQNYEDQDKNVIERKEVVPPQTYSETAHDTANLSILLDYNKAFCYVWNKLYRRTLLKDAAIQFERTKISEDFFFNIQVFRVSSHVICIPKSFYHYRKPCHETLTSRYIKDFHLISLRRFQEERLLLKQNNVLSYENINMLSEIHIKHCFASLVNIISNHQFSFNEKYLKLKEMLSDTKIQQSFTMCKVTGFEYKFILYCMEHKKNIICFLVAWLYLSTRNRKHGKIN